MKYRNIFWDFDGVILDSMRIRNSGFAQVLKDYPKDEVEQLMDYHTKNGGLSRYVKFRYFQDKILGIPIDEDQVMNWSESFSRIMRNQLVDENLLIHDSLEFIRKNAAERNFHIVSGSDGEELNFLAHSLGISFYFRSISGSPTPKADLVSEIFLEYGYERNKCCLIGDSINDYDAATKNGIDFIGYNNLNLREKGVFYLTSFAIQGLP